MSKFQKIRQRRRLRAVDSVVATVDKALADKGEVLKALERWKEEMPTEAQMLPKDKYTLFDRKAKRYRKGIHSMLFLGRCVTWVRHGILTYYPLSRAAKVDSCLAKSQPAGLLNGEDDDYRVSLVLYCVYDTVSYGEINGVWRFGEDECRKTWNSRNNPSLYAGTGLACLPC